MATNCMGFQSFTGKFLGAGAMHGNGGRVRKRTNNSFTCWVLLLLTASSRVTELLAESFVVLEMNGGNLVFPAEFYPLLPGSVFRDTILSPPRTEDSWSV